MLDAGAKRDLGDRDTDDKQEDIGLDVVAAGDGEALVRRREKEVEGQAGDNSRRYAGHPVPEGRYGHDDEDQQQSGVRVLHI
jgi:hypothetical protein